MYFGVNPTVLRNNSSAKNVSYILNTTTAGTWGFYFLKQMLQKQAKRKPQL